MTPRPDMTLLPPDAILAMADVMTRANTPEKHKDAKWKRMTPDEHIAAALRHTFAWLGGEKVDPELETSHLANASVRMSMALSLALRSATTDNSNESPGEALHKWVDYASGTLPLMHTLSKFKPGPDGMVRWPKMKPFNVQPEKPEAWWEHQDEAGWEGNHHTSNPGPEFKVGDRVVLISRPELQGTIQEFDPPGAAGFVYVTWGDTPGANWLHRTSDLLPAPTKTLDDFTPDQWDTAADRSKDIWAETKV